ncbi:murein transglycosylase [Enterobacteriaceae bacterium A-F18]|nr:murein transglycosylase [Enterobacteriaceae bacterium ENNIH3]AUV07344.1 murein transglycosylase [Enterobacteriaceae bacterium ENNIH2]PTA94138.1 murein transglycosylase [Kluyvera sp. Nf5]PWF53919.1 murein transglycosylase [[Kluyvera] intestini]QIH62066.1 murein transglycosylase [Enterobacteriaceae bacterium A-F18]
MYKNSTIRVFFVLHLRQVAQSHFIRRGGLLSSSRSGLTRR